MMQGQAAPASANRGRVTHNSVTWLGVERILIGLALVVAAWLRFFYLDYQPLSSLEAGYAWSAWRLAEGMTPSWTGANPLFLTLQSGLFWLVGGHDFWARALGALAGVGCVYLATTWRLMLGRTTALLLACLLAVTPWQVTLGRMGAGGALSLVVGMLAVTLLIQLLYRVEAQSDAEQESTRRRGLAKGLGVTLGLLLISGPLAWSFVLLLVLWAGLAVLLAKREVGDDPVSASDSGSGTGRKLAARMAEHGRVIAAVGLATAVVGATGLLARPNGLAGIAHSFSIWLGQLGFGVGDATTQALYFGAGDGAWLLLRVLADQGLLTLAGVVGLAYAWYQRLHSARTSLPWLPGTTVWFGLGLFLLLLPGPKLADGLYALAFFGVPCLIGAAWLLVRLVTAIPEHMDRVEALSVVITLLILLTAMSIWFTGLTASVVLDLVLVQVLLAIVGMVLLLLSLYAYWSGVSAMTWLVACFVLVLALGGGIRASWANNLWAQGRSPSGAIGESTHESVRTLQRDLETLSAQRTGDPRRMHVYLDPGLLVRAGATRAIGTPATATLAQAQDPLLAWYLRNFKTIAYGERAPARRSGEPMATLTPHAASRQRSTGPAMSERTDRSTTVDPVIGEGVHADTYYVVRSIWRPVVPAFVPEAGMSRQDRLQLQWRSVVRPILRWLVYREPPIAPEVQEVRVRILLAPNP